MTPAAEYWAPLDTPIGPLTVRVAGDGALLGIDFTAAAGDGPAQPERCREPLRQLSEYFAGARTHFDLPLRLRGSDFQCQVWEALSRIPYGQALSYGELARALGRPGAARAVGQANGANPIPIVIPCHRVVATNGGLGGFSGGLETKRWLLAHEGAGTPGLL